MCTDHSDLPPPHCPLLSLKVFVLFMSIHSVLSSPEFNQGCLSDNGFGAVHCSLVDSGQMTPLLPEASSSLRSAV